MMNRAKTFLLILGIAIISGCASHGKNIMSAFQQEDVTTKTLQEKMKWLEPVVAEGDTHEQFRIVKTLRYNTKYNSDLEKRKLAVQGLIFVSTFSRDDDVRSSANSRLTTILNDPDEDLSLRQEVVEGKKDLVLGQTFYEEKDTSLFSNKIEIERVYPEEDYREEALIYLIDSFEDLEADMQHHIISAFNQILGNQPVCIENDDEGCEETDAGIQEEWKKRLGNRINYWTMNTCDWNRDTISEPVKDALKQLMTSYPNFITADTPVCADFHPVSEDYTVLEMRSIKIPHNYWQFGVDLADALSNGAHASNLEFGFGNGKSIGIILGININEQWVEPLREKYATIQYRPPNSNSVVGFTRTIRTSDITLVKSDEDDVDGTKDGDSKFAYTIDENEFFIASAFELNPIDSHLHIYLGPINQKVGLQYFFRKPDISFIVEGSTRTEMETKKRETDTAENGDRSERQSEANDLQSDLLLGAKWNHISLLKPLFVGRSGRAGRQGIFNFKLYHSIQRQKTYFVVTSPF